jgi:hypothetical protein
VSPMTAKPVLILAITFGFSPRSAAAIGFRSSTVQAYRLSAGSPPHDDRPLEAWQRKRRRLALDGVALGP